MEITRLKITRFIRYNIVKCKFRYLVRYRYYILPFILVIGTSLITSLVFTNSTLRSYLLRDSANLGVLNQDVLTISILVLLTIATTLYFWIDYHQHNYPLKQADPSIHYSFIHHLKVVSLPLLKFKWKPLAYATSLGILTIIALVVTLYINISNVQAASNVVTTINQKTGTADPNPSYTSVFEVVFSDPIDESTFTDPDITLAGTAPGQAVQSITESGNFDKTTYDVRISATSAGTITPSIAADLVTSLNNPSDTNNASTSTDNSVTYDGTYAPDEFVTTWKTDNLDYFPEDSSNDSSIRLLINGGGYNYSVDWDNDGVFDQSGITTSITHDFGVAGTYTIRIKGSFPRFRIYQNAFTNDYDDSLKILSVDQWGSNNWTSMQDAFYYSSNLGINAYDAPNLSNVSDLSNMFYRCRIEQSLNHWDVSNVTNMSNMFDGNVAFNQPLDNWDVSNVTNMSNMFNFNWHFNQSLNSWDVSSVTDMNNMFAYALDFNQNIDNWDVSNVTNMSNMFYNAHKFDQTLNSWNVSSVTDMSHMFLGAYDFNLPLDNWDVSRVTDMSSMFYYAGSFNQPIDNWNVSNVTTMHGMFGNADVFNQPLNSWDVSNVTNMGLMFSWASYFNQPLDSWDVSSVTDMNSMFSFAYDFNQPLNSWDVSNVTNMGYMFGYTEDFNQPLYSWDVGSVTDMSHMFRQAESFNSDITSWNVGNVINMSYMFNGAYYFDQNLNTWDVSSVTDMSHMFDYTWDFNQPLDNWNVSNVTDMSSMFEYNLAFNQSINTWDVSSVIDMSNIFKRTREFDQPVNNWDVSSVTDMREMFLYAEAFDQSLASWNISNVGNMEHMFGNIDLELEQTYDGIPYEDWPNEAKNLYGLPNSGLSTIKYDETMTAWSVLILPNNITFDAGSSNYCNSGVSRQAIIDTYSWTINDAGENCLALTATTNSATSIAQDSAQLNGEVIENTGGTGTTVGFEYGLTTSYGSSNNQSVVDNFTGSFNTGISSLDCETTYHYRAYATNSTGTSYGEDSEFTTSECYEPPPTYTQTDISLNISLLNTSSIKQNDQVRYKFTARNEGPNNAYAESIYYVILPIDFTFGSIETAGYELQIPPTAVTDLGSPVLASTYPGSKIIAFSTDSNTSSIPFNVNSSIDIVISGTASADYSDSSNEIIGVFISPTYESSFSDIFTDAIQNDQNAFILPYNNVASHTYTESSNPPTPTPNQLPNVSLTKPVNNYHFASDTTSVDLAATASDSDGTISKVRFYLNGTYIGEDTTAPYQATASNLSSGDYTVKAVAYDNTGTHTTSSPRVFTILAPGEPTPNPNPPPYTPPEPQDPSPYIPGTNFPNESNFEPLEGIPKKEELGRQSFGLLPLPIYNFVNKFSDFTAQLISWLLLLILLVVSLVYGYKAYRKYLETQRLIATLTNLQNTKQATDNYLSITNHYLNTPVAIMSGATELLASGNKVPTTTVEHLQKVLAYYRADVSTLAVNGQLSTTDNKTSLDDSRPVASTTEGYFSDLLASIPRSGSAFRERAVYLPVGIVSLTLAIVVFMFTNAQVYVLSPIQLGLQILCLILFSLILAANYRQRDIQAVSQRVNQQAINNEKQLLEQRMAFIKEATTVLDNHYENLSIACRNLASVPEAKTLLNGLAMLGDTTSSLNNVSRLSHMSADAPVIGLNQETTKLVADLSPSAKTKNIKLNVNIPEKLQLAIQPEELKQLITSTVDNAIKFSPEGSNVYIKAKKQAKEIAISIIDQGQGIPKDKLQQLFQPFTKATDIKTFDHPGLGLNLYVDKLVTSKLGGSIQVTNSRSSGAAVTIKLPSVKSEIK